MKRPLLFIAATAAVFAAGYWAGTLRTGSMANSGKQGPLVSAAGGKDSINGEAQSGGAGHERAFVAGHPFVKGQAKAWLLSLAAKLKESGGNTKVAIGDLAQVFLTMDEESAVEVQAALKELLALYAAGDPELTAIPDGDDLANGALVLTAFRLSQLNPAAAVAMLKNLPKDTPDEAFKFVFARLAMQDPEQAEAMLEGLDPKRRQEALEGILDTVAGKDPVAALTMADKHFEEVSEQMHRRMVARFMKTDPQRGIAAIVTVMNQVESNRVSGGDPHDDPNSIYESLRTAIEEWDRRDSGAVKAWAESLTGSGEVTAKAWLLEQKAEVDPRAAQAEFSKLEQRTFCRGLSHTAGIVVRELIREDFPAAREWALSSPAGAVRDELLPPVLTQWAKEDSAAASAWIAKLPPGMERDNAIDTLSDAIKLTDPTAAFEWARSIQHPDRRAASTRSVLDAWATVNPEAAKAAAATAGEAAPETP